MLLVCVVLCLLRGGSWCGGGVVFLRGGSWCGGGESAC